MFTAAELDQRINLAAAFLRNPFVAPFAAVDRAVIDKQTFETQFITHFLCDRAGWLNAAPSTADAIQRIDAGFRDVHAGLLDHCGTTVRPVTHAITIEKLATK